MPRKQSEVYYEKNAKSDCKECKGLGLVVEYHSQDDAKHEPCETCFPDDPYVIALREERRNFHIDWYGKNKIIRIRIP